MIARLSMGLVAFAIAACSRAQPSAVTLGTLSAAPSASAAASASAAPGVATRCLPVVAASCGCVYTCGTGTEISPGKWRVIHPFWGTNPIDAKISPWCVGGACTDAFHGEIACSIVCAPKPADPTCHFAGSACVSGLDAAPH